MSKQRLYPKTFNACLLILFLASSSLAKEPPVAELSGGYQYVFDIPAIESVPQGFFVSAGWNATGWLSIVGEFAGSSKTVESDSFKIYTTMGGVRFRKGGFFGQFLIGQFALRFDEERSSGRFEETATDTAIQPGVGWDIRLSNRVSARIQVDYRQLLSDEDEYGQELRVAAGVVVGFGGS